jgi:hypothetical protein
MVNKVFDDIKLGDTADMDKAVIWWSNLSTRSRSNLARKHAITPSVANCSYEFRRTVLLHLFYKYQDITKL